MNYQDTKEKILRLAKPVRKGVGYILFGRFLIVTVSIFLHLFLLLALYLWLRGAMPYFSLVQLIFCIAMMVYLFNNDMDPMAKLTWMFFFCTIPILGAVLLLFTQVNLGHRALQARVAQINKDTMHALSQDPDIIARLEKGRSGLDDLATFIRRTGCYPVYDKTQVTYFPSGEAKFEALLEELKKAEKFIFLEYFIIEEGYMWGKVLEILEEKVAEGVDVRVLYDGFCEISNLPLNYTKLLAKTGIKAKVFAKIMPIVSSHYNYRDHRKILVIDGKVAFNGGVNLADEYINRIERFGHWKDTAVMLKGKAVKSFTLMFLQMWNIDEAKPVYEPYLSDPETYDDAPALPASDGGSPSPVKSAEDIPEKPAKASHRETPPPSRARGYVMPYADCPLDEYKVGETVYIDVLYRANDYVHIMTPYLILDGELLTAIIYAAERGVDVKIILPGIPDKKGSYALAKAHYKRLIEAGVHIYEYNPGFVHAKVVTSDNVKAIVGTINLDYRSLYHHFECATYMYRTDCIADIEQDFQMTLRNCRTVTPETIANEKMYYKVWGRLLKFFAPLM